jgi:hypothetical protein
MDCDADSLKYRYSLLYLMQIACWPNERGGEKEKYNSTLFAEEECEGRKENCVRFVRFYSVQLLLEHNYHIDQGMHI